MLNYLTIWSGWIGQPIVKDHEKVGVTKSEFATFERMVLKARRGITAPTPTLH